MSIAIEEIIEWMDEALNYVGCSTWSPSLEAEGRKLLSRLMQEQDISAPDRQSLAPPGYSDGA